jgi:phage tail-like protein
MGKPFTVNINRYDPYKTYRFLVYFGTSTSPVAAVSKVTGLKRSSDVIDYKEGGNAIILKGMGRTKYEPITLERGLTQDLAFHNWAGLVWNYGSSLGSEVSLANFRKDIYLEFYNEAGQLVIAYKIFRCWVSEYQAMPDLDANANAIAVEHIKLELEGFERDTGVTEPAEPTLSTVAT